ncbi:MAG: ferritin-like domain-containing protein [Alphaproteobacteria bacterium]
MKITSLQKLYTNLLQDMYSAEKQLVQALPKTADAVTSEELREGLDGHLEETREQVLRLEEAFRELGVKPGGETCEAMKGLIAEAKELIDADMEPELLDAALIVACQKIEHYEIASYGALRTYAAMLGLDKSVRLLDEILKEEKGADKKLNQMALSFINERAQAVAA